LNLRDTSVNVATAFHQAASNAMPSASEPHPLQSRRIAAPPSKVRKPNSAASNRSVQEDSSIDRSARAKSPMLEALDGVRNYLSRALSPPASTTTTSYFLQEPGSGYQPLHVPEPTKPPSRQGTKASTVPSNDSYDYEAEERMVRDNENPSATSKASQHKKKKSISHSAAAARLSLDNKAYRPSSDEDSDYVSDENSGRKRKKKKKDAAAKGLVSLPTIGYDKRRKKRRSGAHGEDEDEDEEGSSGEQVNWRN